MWAERGAACCNTVPSAGVPEARAEMIIPAVERTERCAAAEWKTRRDEFMAGRSLGVARFDKRAWVGLERR